VRDALDAPIIAEASGLDKAACQLWHASCNVHAVQHSLAAFPEWHGCQGQITYTCALHFDVRAVTL
jgi:hypothetical protein